MAKNKSIFNVPKPTYPQIYVYSDKHTPEWLKVGFTTRKNSEDRIKEQYNTRLQLETHPYNYLYHADAVRNNGTTFTDKDVHSVLINNGIEYNGEFFKTDIGQVKSAIQSVIDGKAHEATRFQTFKMRDEQQKAIDRTGEYFKRYFQDYPDVPPKFLWNCKMRFGKTFTSYKLALEMGFKKVLVITYKPAVESSWKEDLLFHIDFERWQFAARDAIQFEYLDLSKPYVAFASFQDLLGTTEAGEIKEHNEWIHLTDWDMVIFDEYHFGAWRDAAKELTATEPEDEEGEDISKDNLQIKSKCFLYLSGTPFRAIETGEFAEGQIYNWTYSDEQRVKAEYVGDDNPYASLPQIMLLTYKLPDHIREVAERGEFNEFDLNYFFKASGEGKNAKFINSNAVQQWLDLIRGAIDSTTVDDLKLGAEKPPFPFTDKDLKKILLHMIWFLPDVASCDAMGNLLTEPQNRFYHDFDVLVAAGTKAGVGIKAIDPIKKAMKNPLETKTITLTCGKLTTGVTIKPWTGIFMLRSLKTPETYFQAAFRVQSPWVIDGEGGVKEILKTQCFIFDFDPNRALAQIATYADKLDTRDVSPETKVSEFIKYLPVLAYDGFAMEEVDAAGLLDMAMGRTTATLLAKGWNSLLLVNVDNAALKNLAKNEQAMAAINSIESFRSSKDDEITNIIINKSDEIEGLRSKKEAGILTPEEKKKLTDEEKKYKKDRELIQDKLKALATRIPLFMYLTDIREEKLTDVITKLEPDLFKKVTGLTVQDFELLVSLGLFNDSVMNHAVYNFRRYEDASMSYSGINKHVGESIGYFNMTVTRDEYEDERLVP